LNLALEDVLLLALIIISNEGSAFVMERSVISLFSGGLALQMQAQIRFTDRDTRDLAAGYTC